ncbi:hypothetical protein OIU77_002158 [Salix suchowensis]|uniref:NLP1-9 GAF domain-containing protein n=1 Tax=Salix suchowensis TaxID=1278906 RepID=A0ABQ9B3V3_9ROSI|nr:hypothetical protein OIU77_002158 [Salix suchowensis]
MSDSRVLHLEKSACYLNDFTMVEFMEAYGEHHLEEGNGVAGKALQLNSMYFVSDISKLDVNDYPFIFYSWEFGLHCVVAIKLASMHISSINYVLDFFLPLEMKEISAQRLLVNEIVSILQKNSRNSWRVCNDESSGADICSEVEIMAEEVRTITITPTAYSDKSTTRIVESGSLNSSQIRFSFMTVNVLLAWLFNHRKLSNKTQHLDLQLIIPIQEQEENDEGHWRCGYTLMRL